MTNVPIDFIEWMDQSSVLNNISNTVNLTMLEYTIPLVTDDLHGQKFTCMAVAGDTTYTEEVDIQVEGTCTCSGCGVVCYIHTNLCMQFQLAH